MERIRTVALLTMIAGASLAQTSAPPHAPDGNVFERVVSISIPSVPNAPFTATVVTELTKTLPDGTTSTMKNHRTVSRDSSGRVFQERRYFTPTGDVDATRLRNLQYEDPNRHEYYDCRPMQKTCYVYPYSPAPSVTPASTAATLKRNNVTDEAIGTRTIDTLEALGSRETMTIAAGTIGNKNPQPVVKEFWYSPHLQINLVVKRFDPRSGSQDFKVTNISLAEPDPATLNPPVDYQLVKGNPGER